MGAVQNIPGAQIIVVQARPVASITSHLDWRYAGGAFSLFQVPHGEAGAKEAETVLSVTNGEYFRLLRSYRSATESN